MFSRFLKEQAERCIQLAYQCQTKNAERFLRLLAVDLMLAAQLQRPKSNATDALAELVGSPARPAEISNPKVL